MWRRSSVIVGLVFLALVVAFPVMANHSWGDYHWDGDGLPRGLTLENNLDGSWDPVLGSVVFDWDDEDTNGTLDLGSGSDSSNVCGDPLGGEQASADQIEVCNDSYGDNGWLGVARIWLASDGTHITAAVAAVNDYYLGDGGAYDNANARQHVLCQEVGHTFGLDHQKGPRNQTCMNDQWGLTSDNFVSPNAHDYEQLADIYAHLGGTSDGGGDDGGGGGNCPPKSNSPDCRSGSPGGGPHSVERLPNGQIVVTWITWAPGLNQ